mmetsp:Transcript_83828/g.256133  ORF Transcript_83828/g.256133 Transcript_83828/m.256133 type:complete len:222 (-) Transcript_83828:509-1174(-)
MLRVVPPREFITLAFFAGGSGPAVPGARFLLSPDVRGGRKLTSTAVHCAAPALAGRARVTISPQAARGCCSNSPPRATSSCGRTADATDDEVKSKNGCSSEPFNATHWTSGRLMMSGDLEPVSCTSFQWRSPRDRLTEDSAPVGCRSRAKSPSPWTAPPAKRIRITSFSMMPCLPPSFTGVNFAGPDATHMIALHCPNTAVNNRSPMSSATAAPQPSVTSC